MSFCFFGSSFPLINLLLVDLFFIFHSARVSSFSALSIAGKLVSSYISQTLYIQIQRTDRCTILEALRRFSLKPLMSAIPEQPAVEALGDQLQSIQLDSSRHAASGTHPNRPYVQLQRHTAQRQPLPRPQPQAQAYQPYAQAYTPYPQHYPQAPYTTYLTYSPYPNHLAWRPLPGSEQTSPIDPTNQHQHQHQHYGLWGSPPVSPVNVPPRFLAGQSHAALFDDFGVGGGVSGACTTYYGARPPYGSPPSVWPSPTAPSSFFYTPFQQRASGMGPALQVTEWSTFNGNVNLPGPSKPRPISPADSKEPERKSYHPQPPSKRSDWVMWVGNV